MSARLRARGWLAAVVLLGVIGLVSGCGGSNRDSDAPARPAGKVVELKGIEPLREAFDRDAGKARLLLLLSPT